MNKNQYLQEFKNGLSIFEEDYQQKKVLELDDKISKMVNNGKSEEEVLSRLGEVSNLVLEIYHENHVNYKKEKMNFFQKNFTKLVDTIHYVIDVMSKNSAKANMKIIFDLLVLIFLICLLKIPFLVIQDWGTSLLDVFSIPLFVKIWYLIIDFIYIVVAIIAFAHIFIKWFEALKVRKK